MNAAIFPRVIDRLRQVVGSENLLSARSELLVYAFAETALQLRKEAGKR